MRYDQNQLQKKGSNSSYGWLNVVRFAFLRFKSSRVWNGDNKESRLGSLSRCLERQVESVHRPALWCVKSNYKSRIKIWARDAQTDSPKTLSFQLLPPPPMLRSWTNPFPDVLGAEFSGSPGWGSARWGHCGRIWEGRRECRGWQPNTGRSTSAKHGGRGIGSLGQPQGQPLSCAWCYVPGGSSNSGASAGKTCRVVERFLCALPGPALVPEIL